MHVENVSLTNTSEEKKSYTFLREKLVISYKIKHVSSCDLELHVHS